MDNTQFGASVILYKEDQVLLQLRTFDAKSYPGFWSTFGGHIEEGEQSEAAAVREIEEELGLQLELSQLVRLGSASVLRGDTPVKIHFFAAALEVELSDLILSEGAGFGFFPAREIQSLRLTPATKLALDRHYERLGFRWDTEQSEK